MALAFFGEGLWPSETIKYIKVARNMGKGIFTTSMQNSEESARKKISTPDAPPLCGRWGSFYENCHYFLTEMGFLNQWDSYQGMF